MSRRLSITSNANDRLKALRRLGRRPRRDGVVLVEGHRQLRCALEAGASVREVYAAPELFLGDSDGALVTRAERAGADVYELGRVAFESISRQVRPDGLAALVERRTASLSTLEPSAEPLLVVADAIERPGNLGTIVRTAAAAGAEALLVCDAVTDPFHEETVRAAVGTLFGLTLVEATSRGAVAWLREHDVRIAAASPGGPSAYWEAELTGRVAVVLGNERHGLPPTWLAAADDVVAIPMPGPADSLNVAVAAGIVLFEAARQRALR